MKGKYLRLFVIILMIFCVLFSLVLLGVNGFIPLDLFEASKYQFAKDALRFVVVAFVSSLCFTAPGAIDKVLFRSGATSKRKDKMEDQTVSHADTTEQKGLVDGAVEMVEDASLEALSAALTPEHVAMVESLAEGFILTAVVDAIGTSVPVPFVAALLKRLVTSERVHAVLKLAEQKIVEEARALAAKTANTFDDKVVEVVAGATQNP